MRGAALRVLLLCAGSASVVGMGMDPVVTFGSGGTVKTVDTSHRAWASTLPVQVRFYVDCNMDTVDPKTRACNEYAASYGVAYDGGLITTYSLNGFQNVDIPEMMSNYTLANWGELWDPSHAPATCANPRDLCTRMQACTIRSEYWGSVYDQNGVTYNNFNLEDGRIDPKFRWDRQQAACNMCTVSPCANPACPNGKYTNSPGPLSTGDLTYQMPTCSLCKPGYWLTCQLSDSCTYVSPTKSQWETRGSTGKLQWISRNRKGVISEVPMMNSTAWPMLTDQCYPCATARNRMHYGGTIMSSDTLFDAGFLTFTCPGGAMAPQLCPVNEVANIDPVLQTSTECNCTGGYYRPRAGGACTPCEAGYFCTFFDGKLPCPVDTYSYAASSACIACTRNTGVCPANMALTRCAPGFQTEDARCVDCQICQQVAPASQGAVPCYRLSSV